MSDKKPAAQHTHAKIPPSTMSRVMACPGSNALERTVPKRESTFTDEGHAAHALAERALKDATFDTRLYLGQTLTLPSHGTETVTATVTEDLCAGVQPYVDAVKQRLATFRADPDVKAATLFVEQRIDVSAVMAQPGQFGYADTVILVERKDGTGLVSIEDLKYGKGVPVVADNNVQLMIYGAGAVNMFQDKANITRVELVIHMSRLNYTSVWGIDTADLNTFRNKTQAAVAEAMAQEKILKTQGVAAMTFNKGADQCRFCNAKGICPAYNAASAKKDTAKPVPRKPKPGK